ncbi:MAG: hypothetical protein ACO1OB_24840 [Archangium sp.]
MSNTTAAQNEAKTSNGSLDAAKAAELVAGKLKKNVEKEVGRVQRATSNFADGVMTTARENPKATAGVMLGVGVLLGALVHRLAFPRRTMTELFSRAVRDGAAATSHTLMMGMKSAGRMMR